MKYRLLVISFLALAFLSPAQVAIQANLPKVIAPNSEFAFDVKITKGAIANFAKYQIDVPEGVTLSEVETKTGSFSFENNRGKIIWVAIPTESEFSVIFRLTAGQLSGSGTFNQKFYFLENGTKKEVEAEPLIVNFSGTASPRAETAPVTAKDNVITSSPNTLPVSQPTTAPPKQEPVAETAPVKPVEEKSTSEKSIDKLKEQFKQVNEAPPVSVASGGVVYRIQIGAYGENPGKAKYKTLPDVSIIKEGDFYKVLVGNFKNKEEAVARKTELVEKGFKGFVVAYQNGSRVK